MKKLLGILVLGLLVSGNVYGEVLTWNCGKSKNLKWINWQLDLEKKQLASQFENKNKKDDQIARIISVGDGFVIAQDYIKGTSDWNPISWEFNYKSGAVYTEYKNNKYYYGDCKFVSKKKAKKKKVAKKKKIDKKKAKAKKKKCENCVYEYPFSNYKYLFTKKSPTTFKKLTFIKERKISGVSKRQTYSARYNKKKVFRSFSFIAEYEDNITVEFFIEYEKDIKDFKKAEKKALLFSKMYGQMPLFLKTYNKKIYIHNDLAETRGIGKWWVMYDKQAFHINAVYKSEICDYSSKYSQCAVTMIHELAHVIQHLTGVISPSMWLKARRLDNKKYCSKYSKKNSREDFAESMVCWIVARHKSNKIHKSDVRKINQFIPNRLKFFDEMNFNMHPL